MVHMINSWDSKNCPINKITLGSHRDSKNACKKKNTRFVESLYSRTKKKVNIKNTKTS